MQNHPDQNIQRRVASVGAERRQENNNRKLVEYYKQHPVKAGINIKGLEDNKKKPVQDSKKPPIQKKNIPKGAASKPSPVNRAPNVYPSWWG
jgi:hypothetical protein